MFQFTPFFGWTVNATHLSLPCLIYINRCKARSVRQRTTLLESKLLLGAGTVYLEEAIPSEDAVNSSLKQAFIYPVLAQSQGLHAESWLR
jgi:hypothetical protein